MGSFPETLLDQLNVLEKILSLPFSLPQFFARSFRHRSFSFFALLH